MKTLAIENDYQLPEESQAWCDAHPELVGKVDLLWNAKNQDPADLAGRIRQYNQFVIDSTFSTYGQVEELLEAFDKGLFGPGPWTFFVKWLGQHLEEWDEKDKVSPELYSYRARGGFRDHASFIERLIRMVREERLILYSILSHQHWTTDTRTNQVIPEEPGWDFRIDETEFPNEFQRSHRIDDAVTRWIYNSAKNRFEEQLPEDFLNYCDETCRKLTPPKPSKP